MYYPDTSCNQVENLYCMTEGLEIQVIYKHKPEAYHHMAKSSWTPDHHVCDHSNAGHFKALLNTTSLPRALPIPEVLDAPGSYPSQIRCSSHFPVICLTNHFNQNRRKVVYRYCKIDPNIVCNTKQQQSW